MKTRLALARAVLHAPDLLLLDEPTSGLDPESAAAVLELIRTMTADGRTVLMCTHLLLEAEGLADRIVVMDGGTTVLSGVPGELAVRYWPERIVSITAERGDDLDRLADLAPVATYERSGQTATITLIGTGAAMPPDPVPDLVADLVASGVRVRAVEPYRPSLEDLYFAIRRERLDLPAPLDPERSPVPVATAPIDGKPVDGKPVEDGVAA